MKNDAKQLKRNQRILVMFESGTVYRGYVVRDTGKSHFTWSSSKNSRSGGKLCRSRQFRVWVRGVARTDSGCLSHTGGAVPLAVQRNASRRVARGVQIVVRDHHDRVVRAQVGWCGSRTLRWREGTRGPIGLAKLSDRGVRWAVAGTPYADALLAERALLQDA